MASALGVSRSGYYTWVKNSQRSAKGYRKEFDQLVRSIFDRSKQRYGSVRITQELRLQGIPCGRHRVNRSMRRQKLRARGKLLGQCRKEFLDGQVFSHLADAERYLFEYIEIDDNNHHRHSTLAFRTPIEMEQHYWDSIQEEARNVA